jgi:hypothetical protein
MLVAGTSVPVVPCHLSGTFEALPAGRRPARIDLRLIGERVDPAKACHGIYALDDNKLKLCLGTEFSVNDPAERPLELKTGSKWPPEGRLLFVMERVKK